jgi:uncharacterized protein YbaR (Trm112 family)
VIEEKCVIDKDYLSMLACPDTRQALEEATAEQIQALNQRIAQGKVTNKGGTSVKDPIEAGLVRKDGKALYPIVDRIPVLLVDESIPL